MLVLNHGQASVERGYSLRNATLKDNISELSLNSKHLITDHILSNDLRSETIKISTLLVAFKSARTKYEEVKRAMKKYKEKFEEENLAN